MLGTIMAKESKVEDVRLVDRLRSGIWDVWEPCCRVQMACGFSLG